jgi:predicted short-subunit dehydrogenase-like oxidoreductase (DUF2520 family)
VVGVYAVSDLSRLRAQALLPDAPVMSVAEVIGASDLVLATVPDDVLAGLVAGLVDTGLIRAGQFLAHTSGRYGFGILDQATRMGALPLALHPVMTFTGTSIDLARLDGAPFGVTAPEPLRPVAEALVVEMGGEPIWITEGKRPLYHAALAHGSNHLMTLVGQTLELLTQAGVEEPVRLVAPLLSASLDNALRYGDQVLTGPVARGDARTVAAHLDALSFNRQALDTYVTLARATADRALAAGVLTPQAAESLLDVLSGRSGR